MDYRQGVYLIIRKGNKFLLAHNKSNPPNEFFFPGGGLEDGESHEDAFYRESHEELGLTKNDFISVVNTKKSHKHPWPKEIQDKYKFLGQEKVFFIATIKENTKINIELTNELDEIKWINKTEIIDNLPFEDLKQSVSKIIDLF